MATERAHLRIAMLGTRGVPAAYGHRGLDRVRRHYSWDDVTDGYERLFHELLGQGADAR